MSSIVSPRGLQTISIQNILSRQKAGLRGSIQVPGDKSISHRALMFGALAEGRTEITGLLQSADIQSTWRCLEALGVEIQSEGERVFVKGKGMDRLSAPDCALDCGNSGTTMRLMMGILAGQPFHSILTGDESLRVRPMKRVAIPLRLMGAEVETTAHVLNPAKTIDGAPVSIWGQRPLKKLGYQLEVASAQLKSALLLAGLFSEGETVLSGKIQSRDHTERMLPYFGAKLEVGQGRISIQGGGRLLANEVVIPGDISSAAFWMAAASLVPGSEIEIQNVCLNPTRDGLLRALRRMGAKIEIEQVKSRPEPSGNLRIGASDLKGISIGKSTAVDPGNLDIPSLIDEIPILAVVATQASGRTVIQGAEELRFKETDRLQAIAQNLRVMGIQVELLSDGLIIEGPQKLKGAELSSMGDHRIAMAFAIAGLMAEGETVIQNAECVSISYPNFFETLAALVGGNA